MFVVVLTDAVLESRSDPADVRRDVTLSAKDDVTLRRRHMQKPSRARFPDQGAKMFVEDP